MLTEPFYVLRVNDDDDDAHVDRRGVITVDRGLGSESQPLPRLTPRMRCCRPPIVFPPAKCGALGAEFIAGFHASATSQEAGRNVNRELIRAR